MTLAVRTRPVGRLRDVTRPVGGTLDLAIVVGLVFSLVVLPRQMLAVNGEGHFGIAPPGIGVSTFGFVIWGSLVALLASSLAGHRQAAFPFWQLAFGVFAVLGLAVLWPVTGEREGGVLQLTTGVAAWVVGRWLAPRLMASPALVGQVAWVLAGLIGFEFAVSLAQLAGIGIFPLSERLAAIMGDRVNGTLGHPDTLGKVVFIVTQLALLLLPLATPRHRRVLWAAIILGLGPLILCQGRATLLATVALLVLWAVGSRGAVKAWVRAALPVAVIVILAPFAGVFIERMQADPDGGPRAQLQESAFRQIDREPLSGIGPNSYVSVVSAYDSVVAQGYPVHNAFLLTGAELGIPGALVFWMPLLLLSIVAVVQLRSRTAVTQNAAVTFSAGLPGILLIVITGWGMLQWSMLPLWFLVLGVFQGVLGPNYATLAASWRAAR